MGAHEINETSHEGFDTITLVCRETSMEAAFAPSVGMIGCSVRHQGEELLGQRGGLARYAETGSTMGIPLLHPWANRLSGFECSVAGRTVRLDPESGLVRCDPNGLPIHGLLNAFPHWHVQDASADESAARLRAKLDFGAHADLLGAFPFPHELAIDVTLAGEMLEIGTVVRATGDVPVPISFGYHPYLRLPDVPRPEWQVTLPVNHRLVLDDRMLPTGRIEPVDLEPAPLDDRAFDDAFAGVAEGARFVLVGGGRRVITTFAEGYPFAQVYAPPSEALICFEPMTAPTNALVAGGPDLALTPPGESYSARFSLAVEHND